MSDNSHAIKVLRARFRAHEKLMDERERRHDKDVATALAAVQQARQSMQWILGLVVAGLVGMAIKVFGGP